MWVIFCPLTNECVSFCLLEAPFPFQYQLYQNVILFIYVSLLVSFCVVLAYHGFEKCHHFDFLYHWFLFHHHFDLKHDHLLSHLEKTALLSQSLPRNLRKKITSTTYTNNGIWDREAPLKPCLSNIEHHLVMDIRKI